jgi:hypothetical protein
VTNMGRTGVYKRRANFITRRIAGETLLVPMAGKIADLQRVIALNSVGAFIWEQLTSRQSLDSIAAAVVTEFAVDAESARRDATEFLGQLESANLIESED